MNATDIASTVTSFMYYTVNIYIIVIMYKIVTGTIWLMNNQVSFIDITWFKKYTISKFFTCFNTFEMFNITVVLQAIDMACSMALEDSLSLYTTQSLLQSMFCSLQ